MKYPKMIIFDYGHTLLYEPDWNADRDNAELLRYVVKNPSNCTLMQRLSCLSVGRIMLWEKENFDVFTILAAVILS